MSSFLRPLLRSPAIGRVLRSSTRSCLTFDRGGAYEGDGKTSITVLNRDAKDLLLIDSYSSHGFRINNGLFIVGPTAFFPRTILNWDVEGPWDVTPESLSLFWLLEPKPDVLIIGVGDKGMKISDEVRVFMNNKKISLEVLDTGAACHVFNFMNSDCRNVAAALIPNQTMRLTLDTEQWDNQLAKRTLFRSDGSSMEYVIEARQRRLDLEMERNYELMEQHKFQPQEQVIVADLKDMLDRKMITPAYVKQKYPHYSVEAIMKGVPEEQLRALPESKPQEQEKLAPESEEPPKLEKK